MNAANLLNHSRTGAFLHAPTKNTNITGARSETKSCVQTVYTSSTIPVKEIYEIPESTPDAPAVHVSKPLSVLRHLVERTGSRLVTKRFDEILEQLQERFKEFSEVEGAVVITQSTTDEIHFIQSSLGLTISQLAEILEIQRQTVYNWIAEPTKLQGRTSERLAQIKEIAAMWNKLCSRPAGKLITSLKVEGTTLFDLLRQPSINEIAIKKTLETLAKTVIANVAKRESRINSSVTPPDTLDSRVLKRASSIL